MRAQQRWGQKGLESRGFSVVGGGCDDRLKVVQRHDCDVGRARPHGWFGGLADHDRVRAMDVPAEQAMVEGLGGSQQRRIV